jgi:hypothetical protein
MLYLRTGLPGAGKTLNAIREIDLEHQPDPADPSKRLHKDPADPDLPPRTIYYHGIPDVQTDRLKSKWVEFDTPNEWFNLPDGSVIVIDEAQRIFGTDLGRQRPEKVARFETHRHQGLDIHLITQHPSLLNPAVRKLVGKHINFIRPYGREKGIFRHEYEFCIDAPEKRVNFKQAQEERVALDPAYFGTYKSSTIHTHKPTRPTYLKRVPYLIAFIVLCLSVLGGLGWMKISAARERMAAAEEAKQHEQEALAASSPGASLAPAAAQSAPPVPDYFEQRTPRVETYPASAPRYDDLTKPRDFPRLICAASHDAAVINRALQRRRPVGVDRNGDRFTCSCYTQQVTRVQTTAEFCLNVVENGIFDDTRLPPLYASSTGQLTTSTQPAIEPAANQRGRAAISPPAPVTVISNTEYTSRPWRSVTGYSAN